MLIFTDLSKDKQAKATGHLVEAEFQDYDNLIREGIQNSVDALDEDNHDTVNIKISLHTADTDEIKEAIFESPEEDIKHYEVSKMADSFKKNYMDILTFEDSNTTGIKGDYNTIKSDQWTFWHGEGLTAENKSTGDTGGSRGIGKISFSYNSEIGTFFVQSRNDTNILETRGMALLEPAHEIDGTFYGKDGWFVGDKDNSSLSASDSKTISDTLKLERTEKGTSIAILDPKLNYENNTKKIDKDEFIEITSKLILENFYGLFIENKLNISIHHNEQNLSINSENVLDLLIKYELISYINREFLEEVYNDKNLPNSNIYRDYSEESKNEFKNLFNSGQCIQIDHIFHLKYINENNKTIETSEKVSFFIKKSIESEPLTHIRRFSLRISEAEANASQKAKNKFSYAIIIDPKKTPHIHRILKKLENNSHTKWDNKKIDNYPFKTWDIVLTIQKRLPEFIFDCLNENIERIEKDSLSVFFPKIEKDNTKKDSKSKGKKKNEEVEGNPDEEMPEDLEQTKKIIAISKIDSGVKFYSTENVSNEEIGTEIKLRVAYDLENSNKNASLKNYISADFNLADNNDIMIESEGISISNIHENEITCTIENTEFNISLTNFDEWRDIVAEAKPDRVKISEV